MDSEKSLSLWYNKVLKIKIKTDEKRRTELSDCYSHYFDGLAFLTAASLRGFLIEELGMTESLPSYCSLQGLS